MTRIVYLPLVMAALIMPASAQDAPRGFPLDKVYKAVSISGFDVQKMAMTLVVSRSPKGDGLRGSGSAGCNNWSATAILRDGQVDFTNIVTTKKLCAKPRMTAEDAFLTSLRSARRWQVDADKMIIEGDAARLMLKAGSPEKPAARSKKK